MRELWKTTRVALTIVVVMVAGLWTGVTFLGQSWSDQGHYVVTLLWLLGLIVLSAALLVFVGKGAGLVWDKVWDKLAERRAKAQDDQSPDKPRQ